MLSCCISAKIHYYDMAWNTQKNCSLLITCYHSQWSIWPFIKKKFFLEMPWKHLKYSDWLFKSGRGSSPFIYVTVNSTCTFSHIQGGSQETLFWMAQIFKTSSKVVYSSIFLLQQN